MMREVVRYTFKPSISLDEVQDTLTLAVLAVGSLFGETSVRLDTAFAMDAERRGCVIEANTEVGRALSRIFAGYVTHEFGDDAFSVRRAQRSAQEPAAAADAKYFELDQAIAESATAPPRRTRSNPGAADRRRRSIAKPERELDQAGIR